MGSGTETGSERRSDPRYGAHFDVRFSRQAEAARALNAFSINFSSGGLCVRATNRVTVGEVLSVSLAIEEKLFELEGVVAWVKEGSVGVRFINVQPGVRAQLETVARSLAAKGPALP
ncbi:MAG: PilZ domain-containing protein [Myxococcaceae bacterium]